MNPQQKKKKKPKKQNDDGDYCPKKHELKNAHTNPNSQTTRRRKQNDGNSKIKTIDDGRK